MTEIKQIADMETIGKMFLRTAIHKQDIPFEWKLDVPNETTIVAIEEGKKLITDLSAPRYSSIEALKEALEV